MVDPDHVRHVPGQEPPVRTPLKVTGRIRTHGRSSDFPTCPRGSQAPGDFYLPTYKPLRREHRHELPGATRGAGATIGN